MFLLSIGADKIRVDLHAHGEWTQAREVAHFISETATVSALVLCRIFADQLEMLYSYLLASSK